MSGTIILIVEGQMDGEIVKRLVNLKYPVVRVSVRKPTGNSPSLSRLAKQIDKLIQAALNDRKVGDCIAVLHDADELTRPDNRQDYKLIETTCRKHKRDVVHIIAHDEIEAWLLADKKLCEWLHITQQVWDHKIKPSEELISRLNKEQLPKYRVDHLDKILVQLSGEIISPSFLKALKHLENAPCVKV